MTPPKSKHPTQDRQFMARELRYDFPDTLHHVTNRGLERRDIVRDVKDRKEFVRLLGRVAVRYRWRVFAWVLMNNHCHLFFRMPTASLSSGLHDLESGYATLFNQRHDRSGPLFQGRFHDVVVENASHCLELSRYIHLNPRRAGLVHRGVGVRESRPAWPGSGRVVPLFRGDVFRATNFNCSKRTATTLSSPATRSSRALVVYWRCSTGSDVSSTQCSGSSTCRGACTSRTSTTHISISRCGPASAASAVRTARESCRPDERPPAPPA
jgi:REP element-mobilizing transposase RayT